MSEGTGIALVLVVCVIGVFAVFILENIETAARDIRDELRKRKELR